MTDGDLEKAAGLVRRARRVLVITGAGVSAESGIPTFRDAQQGLWANFDPQQLASPEGFARDPALVWQWYADRLATIEQTEPNAGHRALAALEQRVPDFLLLTQNVDGLHQRAGSRNVHEIHGSIRRVRCAETGRVYAEGEVPIVPPFPVRTPEGRLARPDVVWFGELIHMPAHRAVEDFLRAAMPDLLLLVGTTALFPYIQQWAWQAASHGSAVIEINPEPSVLAEICDVVLEMRAGKALPELVSEPV
ncbi:MAG: NAD-dependent protein deacylase [Candidatus Sumerlaeia bacterium]|nr:NAD-dependent protein deacylase [Candidatus Sumerlaeia bacterium]